MKIAVFQNGQAWDIYPQSGPFTGKLVGRADGLTMKDVSVHDGIITGEVTSVWGMEVIEPMIFNDPRTIRGLGIGRAFDMRMQAPLRITNGMLTQEGTGIALASAKSVWMLDGEAQAFGGRWPGEDTRCRA